MAVGVRRVEELIAWQLAERFHRDVARVLRGSEGANADLRYRNQLRAASASALTNLAEGFSRCSPGEFARFLDFAAASLAEAEIWVREGVERGYFPEAACLEPLRYKRRAWMAIIRLKHSQVREAARRKAEKRGRKRKRPTQ